MRWSIFDCKMVSYCLFLPQFTLFIQLDGYIYPSIMFILLWTGFSMQLFTFFFIIGRNSFCVTWCPANMSLTCLFTYLCWLLIAEVFIQFVITIFVLFLHDCFSQEENKLEFSSPFVNGSASPSWVVLDWDGSGVDSVYFTLFFFFQSRSLSLEGLKHFSFVDNFHLFGREFCLSVRQPSSLRRFSVLGPVREIIKRNPYPYLEGWWWCGHMELTNLASKPSSNPYLYSSLKPSAFFSISWRQLHLPRSLWDPVSWIQVKCLHDTHSSQKYVFPSY